ncbi:hypothetical protein BJ546DRAFT_63680 [Cryomyces antarcticus]
MISCSVRFGNDKLMGFSLKTYTLRTIRGLDGTPIHGDFQGWWRASRPFVHGGLRGFQLIGGSEWWWERVLLFWQLVASSFLLALCLGELVVVGKMWRVLLFWQLVASSFLLALMSGRI